MLQAVAKPWLKSYPPEVAAEIDPSRYASIVELLEESFRAYGPRTAAVCMESRITFREIDELSSALGAWLQAKGLAKGARVALMMPNVPQYMVAIAAVLRAGYVVVNVNHSTHHANWSISSMTLAPRRSSFSRTLRKLWKRSFTRRVFAMSS